ncbi:hypothetical protein KL923_004005 [Ogataea haglerorum]|nr:hypothetical protein KL923_004005 [Ogataea haglerorum]
MRSPFPCRGRKPGRISPGGIHRHSPQVRWREPGFRGLAREATKYDVGVSSCVCCDGRSFGNDRKSRDRSNGTNKSSKGRSGVRLKYSDATAGGTTSNSPALRNGAN